MPSGRQSSSMMTISDCCDPLAGTTARSRAVDPVLTHSSHYQNSPPGRRRRPRARRYVPSSEHPAAAWSDSAVRVHLAPLGGPLGPPRRNRVRDEGRPPGCGERTPRKRSCSSAPRRRPSISCSSRRIPGRRRRRCRGEGTRRGTVGRCPNATRRTRRRRPSRRRLRSTPTDQCARMTTTSRGAEPSAPVAHSRARRATWRASCYPVRPPG